MWGTCSQERSDQVSSWWCNGSTTFRECLVINCWHKLHGYCVHNCGEAPANQSKASNYTPPQWWCQNLTQAGGEVNRNWSSIINNGNDWLHKLKAVLQRRKRKCRIKSKVVYEHHLKELADHHNNIESIIKRAASTSSWKLGPQERKIVSVNCLPSLYRKKCQHKLPLTHTHTIVVLTHRCTCNYSRWRPAGSRADTHDSTMNWNTQYSHQSKLLVLHEIKSNSQLSRHARKITR